MKAKVLVLGGQGMLGSALMNYFGQAACGTSQQVAPGLIGSVDISKAADIERALAEARPEVVINCAGIVKSECGRQTEDRVRAVNTNAPHTIATITRHCGIRFVHISTDCVFSGRRGMYREDAVLDPEDLYGQSKAAGEVVDYDCLTIRTSFIGYDARRRRGLLEWLLAQNGGVPGHDRVLWSGLSAMELARAISLAIAKNLQGLYHVAGPVITKADLLEILIQQLGLRPSFVEHVDLPVLDRTLDGTKFRKATGYEPPSWVDMAKEL